MPKNQLAFGALFLLVIILAGLLGGPDTPFDRGIVESAFEWRKDGREGVERLGIILTFMGGAIVLVPLAVIAAVWLAWKRGWAEAGILLAMTIGGRAIVEALKLIVDRPRPNLEAYPVPVTSLSFPSGHATNSMLTYVALALFLAPEGSRSKWVGAAIVSSIAIGLTRPLLGVHWPTDIIAGWSLGLLWTGLLWAWFNRARTAA